MKIIDRSVSDVIDTEYREYAMYVLESRAVPSAIDGLKMVSRKLLYSMLNEYSGKKVKLADLSGISKLGYHHSETSAASAAVTMTADWNNNCPIFTGHGNFGSRMIQEAAASRYIFATVSPEFKKYFIDSEVAPKQDDPENPEPKFYLPIIPWVLVNGIEGIAVGFKTSILPRDITDIVKATKECLKSPVKFLENNLSIKPTFPHFKGNVVAHSENQWKTQGIIEFVGKLQYKISELPIGYDRETYVTLLNEMCDKDLIKDYSDDCSKTGFGFTIKVSLVQKEKIDCDPLKYFKLEKIHTEILTTLGTDGKLKIFKTVAELIHYFVAYRLEKFGDKLKYEADELRHEINYNECKVKFIELVLDKKFDLRSKTKAQLLEMVYNSVTTEEFGKRFVNIPVYECTLDNIAALEEQIEVDKKSLGIVLGTTPMQRYLSVLKG